MSAKGSRPPSRGTKAPSGTRAGVKTPPKGSKRPPVKPDSAAREVVRGREVEFWGVGCISLGIVLVLSMYLHMAGPLGRAIDTTFGWLLGLGRFALPMVVTGIGVAMVRRRSIQHRLRLTMGWTIVVLAILGFLHLVNGADKIVASVDAMSQAGGWFGAIMAEPLRSTISWAGALVVLFAIAVGGTMLITDTTVPELIIAIRTWTAKQSGSAATMARSASSRDGSSKPYDEFSNDDSDFAPAPSVRERPQTIYDADSDPDLVPKKERAKRRPEPGRIEPVTPEFVGKPGSKRPASSTEESAVGAPAVPGVWVLPSTDLLGLTEVQEVNKARVAERGRLLEESLASHGVETRLVGMTVGPTVTRFELELGSGVKVAKVTSLNRDIAYSMAATDVRILAPIPGKSAVGVEVPNEVRQLVSLGDLISSPEARAATHPLDVAVGKDIAGRAVFLNLAATPHMLIAGATGAGKSCLLYTSPSPRDS